MARVNADGSIEGDPRWVVADRGDGANVNSWHWEERDVTAAAKKLLRKTVTSITLYEQGGASLYLLDLREGGKGPNGEDGWPAIDGEATALNRRRKVGVFFDFTFTVEWHGEIADPNGYASADAQGTLTVKSVDQDCIADVAMEVELDSQRMPGTEKLLRLMRDEGVARMRGLLNHFYSQLRAEYDPRAAAERDAQRAARREAELAAEADEDAARLREEEDIAAQHAAPAAAPPAPPPGVSSAQRREEEAAELREREAAAVQRRNELRDEERRHEDEASRQRLEAAAEERRARKEAARAERAGRPTHDAGTKKTDDELLDFITGD